MCPGNCVPRSPPDWSEPVLFWVGPEETTPDCPVWAPRIYLAGHADLNVPAHACGACSCEPAAGSCTLPATLTAESQPLCAGTATSFDPPASWTGGCTPVNAIPAGQLCNGVLCTSSLDVAPLTLTESGCAPVVAALDPLPAPPRWGTAAYTCVGEVVGTCDGVADICAPVVPPPPPDFEVCIVTGGDKMCPVEFSHKHLVYDHYDDSRSCSACACSAPAGGMCSGVISIFKDENCSEMLDSKVVTSTASSFCTTLPPGTALGSKSAGPLTHTPGTCQASGGDALGSVEPAESTTYCCRP